MAWRIVQQPNGLFARFSEIVDSFTHINYSQDEMVQVCKREHGMDQAEAERKFQNAIDAGAARYTEALEIIERVHGVEERQGIQALIELAPPEQPC